MDIMETARLKRIKVVRMGIRADTEVLVAAVKAKSEFKPVCLNSPCTSFCQGLASIGKNTFRRCT